MEYDEELQQALIQSMRNVKLDKAICKFRCLGEQLYISPVRGDGDCQFHSVATILNSELLPHERPYSVERLRAICKTYVTYRISDETITDLMSTYAVTQADERWVIEMPRDQYGHTSVKSFPRYFADVISERYTFWGDELTLNILSHALKIRFIVLKKHCQPQYQTAANPGSHVAFLYLKHQHYSPVYFTQQGTMNERYIFNHNFDCVQEMQRVSPQAPNVNIYDSFYER